MRRLDSLLGDAACNAFAMLHKLQAPLARKDREVKKIAVMKFFGMGSLIVASPTVAALKEAYPGAEIHFVTFKSNQAILEILGQTDHAYYVDPSTPQTFLRTTMEVVRALRRVGCDLVLDLEFFAKFPLVLSSLAGIPRKAGFYLTSEPWRAELLDVTGSYNSYYHTKDVWMSLAYLVITGDFYYLNFESFAAKYKYPQVNISPFERAAVRAKLAAHGVKNEALYIINANTSPDLAPEARKWPRERYAALADALIAQNPHARVLFIGAKNERDYVANVVAGAKSQRVHCIAGELSLKELLALFAEAELVISNDSGPMHLACLVDAPTIGLFFADSPTLFAPLGSRVRAVAPKLYSIPLFSVYNGKDVAVGKPSNEITNAAACAVSLEDVMYEVRTLLQPRAGRITEVGA